MVLGYQKVILFYAYRYKNVLKNTDEIAPRVKRMIQ